MDTAEDFAKMTPEERKYIGLHMQPQSFVQYFIASTGDLYVNVDVFIEIAKNSHIKYEYDKYSINELTDDINFKLVFIHKKKYYNNSIYLLLHYLFDGFNDNYILDNQLDYPHSLYLLLNNIYNN